MPLAIEIATLLEHAAQPPSDQGATAAAEFSVMQLRAQHERNAAEHTPVSRRAAVAAVTNLTVAGPHGPVDVRVYRPNGPGRFPTLLWIHGGGWVTGSADTVDILARALCAKGMVVVCPLYRLAPENPWPNGLDDCLAALDWVAQSVAELGGDPSSLAVGGDSAGGNIAAVLAQAAAGRGIQLSGQLLLYPLVDADVHTGAYESRRAYASGYTLDYEAIGWCVDQYVPAGVDPLDPRISPLHSPDLSALPPAVIGTAEYDVLRDEGELYARRLAEAGVVVQRHRIDGLVHGSFDMLGISSTARDGLDLISTAFLHLFQTDEGPQHDAL